MTWAGRAAGFSNLLRKRPGSQCCGHSSSAEAAALLACGVLSRCWPDSSNSESFPEIRSDAPHGVVIIPTANPRPSLTLVNYYRVILMFMPQVSGMQVALVLCQPRLILRRSSRAAVSELAIGQPVRLVGSDASGAGVKARAASPMSVEEVSGPHRGGGTLGLEVLGGHEPTLMMSWPSLVPNPLWTIRHPT